MREAGDRTSWADPNEQYEAAVHAAVDAAFDDERVAAVLAELSDRIDGPAWSNALAAKLVALTMPGVPDVYQGTELWDQSLVDPDNRRPVDFAHRGGRARRCRGPGPAEARRRAVRAHPRRDRPDLFTTYAPVPRPGRPPATCWPSTAAESSRSRPGCRSAWRRAAGATPSSRCRPGPWTDVLTGRPAAARVGELLASYPVALLVRDADPPDPRSLRRLGAAPERVRLLAR